MLQKFFSSRKNKYFMLALILVISVSVAYVYISASTFDKPAKYPKEVPALISDGWSSLGDTVTPEEAAANGADEITLYQRLPLTPGKRTSLMFKSHRQGISVTVDGEPIYSLNKSGSKKIILVSTYCIINLPTDKEECDVEINITREKNESLVLPEIYLGSSASVFQQILFKEMLTLIDLVLLIFMGLILLIAIGYFALIGISDQRLIAAFIFIVLTILWGVTDSYLCIFLGENVEFLTFIAYVAFMTMPIPVALFEAFTLKKRYKAMDFALAIVFINVIVQMVLVLICESDLSGRLYFTHIAIIILVICGITSAVTDRKKNKNGEATLMLGALSWLVFITIIALSSYWLSASFGFISYRSVILSGIIGFFGILIFIVIYSYVNASQENKLRLNEMEIEARFSLIDNLSGLKNRRAFDMKVKEIAEKGDNSDAVLVMMDLNGLKYINDSSGHLAGDSIICAAADAISEAFIGRADYFRIGGDEFTAILTGPNIAYLPVILEKLKENQEKYNSDSSNNKLSMAYGFSHLQNSSGKRKTISNWKQEADIDMYVSKMKERDYNKFDELTEYKEIIKCIISIIEAKDLYTGDHSTRVCDISVVLAKNLGLSFATVEQIKLAAQLHDIGKIAIPDSILTKNGKLTEDEFEVIKQHPARGREIVARADTLQEVAEIIGYHHERFDGKGYPYGVSGTEIPIGARIIAIADSIDAMTSDRCYRQAMSLDACFDEIERNLGTMYDPAIGTVALKCRKEITGIVLDHRSSAKSAFLAGRETELNPNQAG